MKNYRITAVDYWGGQYTGFVRANSEKEAVDRFHFHHAVEDLEILEVKVC